MTSSPEKDARQQVAGWVGYYSGCHQNYSSILLVSFFCSDTVNTTVPVEPTCGSDEFACVSSGCIAFELVCDFQSDCPHGSDEENCGEFLTTLPGFIVLA